MSERLESWKAKEKIRSDLGGCAALIGLSGTALLVGVVADLLDYGTLRGPVTPVALVIGIALVVCGVGLWNAKPWARWGAVAFVTLWLASDVMRLVPALRWMSDPWVLEAGERINLGSFLCLPIEVFVAVYLLLPSTGRRFARAQGGGSAVE